MSAAEERANDTRGAALEDDQVPGVSTSKLRPVWLMIKHLVRRPWIRRKLGEFLPNVYFGYTDHPLDWMGTACNSIFSFFPKTMQRRASCVLGISLRERTETSFTFDARGYNVFRIRDLERGYSHEYAVTESTPYELLTLRMDVLTPHVYRLRLGRGATVAEHRTPMVADEPVDPELRVGMDETEDSYRISTGALVLTVSREQFRITIAGADGREVTRSGGKTGTEFVTAMDSFPLGFVRDGVQKRWYGMESFSLHPGEAVYGLGEHFGQLNKVGGSYGLWNWEGLGNTSGRTYKNIPFFASTRGYGVFVNESTPITYWMGSREIGRNQFAVPGDLVDYYFIYGPSLKDVLHRYTGLTGRASVPPRWTFGTWISRITYFSQKQVSEVARRLREMRFPSDVIHIDTGWFETDWLCDWEFDPDRFPDPEGMFEELSRQGFRASLWQVPYVMDETELSREARRKGLVARNRGPFIFLFRYPARAIDFSNPDAVRWYQEKLARLLRMGASAIKVDFGEGIEPHMQFREYDGETMHNLYAMLYNKAVYEITKEVKGRAVIWARSAYAGSQRYPVHWSGDNSSNYENMLCSLRGGLSLGMCGFSFWSQDTGGFVGTPTDELYIRWTQLAIFQSHIRYHGSPPRFREPWNFEPRTQEIVRRCLELRYRLIPYLYSEAHAAARDGLPLMRPLVLEFDDDPTVYTIEDQFMCGRSLLVAPMMGPEAGRRLYLPAGAWYDYWDGTLHEGSRWITVNAPLDRIPVFVRAGHILPLADAAQCTDEIDDEKLTLRIYPDSAGTASYTLITDAAGSNEDNGSFDHPTRTVHIRSERAGRQTRVTVEPRLREILVELPPSEEGGWTW